MYFEHYEMIKSFMYSLISDGTKHNKQSTQYYLIINYKT